jgi:hypothetical protein
MNQVEEVEITYSDKIFTLIGNVTLIGRIIEVDSKEAEDNFFVHSPMEILYDYEGDAHLRKWITHSDDEIYNIPANHVINVSTPERMLGAKYANGFIFEEEHREFFNNIIRPLDEPLH